VEMVKVGFDFAECVPVGLKKKMGSPRSEYVWLS
jgi:hypothetical protein